jgi:hypothetical protein
VFGVWCFGLRVLGSASTRRCLRPKESSNSICKRAEEQEPYVATPRGGKVGVEGARDRQDPQSADVAWRCGIDGSNQLLGIDVLLPRVERNHIAEGTDSCVGAPCLRCSIQAT